MSVLIELMWNMVELEQYQVGDFEQDQCNVVEFGEYIWYVDLGWQVGVEQGFVVYLCQMGLGGGFFCCIQCFLGGDEIMFVGIEQWQVDEY